MKRFITDLVAALACTLACAVIAPRFAQADPILIQGTVTDQGTTQPIVGALVTVYDNQLEPVTSLTDGSGHYAIPAQQGIPISGSLWVSKTGYFLGRPAYDLSSGPVTIDAALVYGGTVLQGVVTDANTAAAIANASVYIGGAIAVTGVDGSYGLDASYVSDPGGFTITFAQVTAAGYLDLSLNLNAQIAPPYPGTINFQMVPSTGTLIQGTVTDQSTAQPIAGALASIFNDQLVAVTSLTDGSGHYAIAAQLGIPISGLVTVRRSGYFVGRQGYDLSSGTPATVDAALVYGGTVLQGTVTDANTAGAIANASVSVGGAAAIAPTGVDGSYGVDASNFSDPGGFAVDFVHVSAAGYFDLNLDPNAQIGPPYPGTINFQMVPSTGTLIQGTITDQGTTQPIVGALVSVFDNQLVAVTSPTDGSGHYAIAAQQGIPISGSVTVSKTGYFVGRPAYDLSSGPATIDVALVYGGTVLVGTVTDANTAGAIANASVHLDAGADIAVTGIDGSYGFDASNFSNPGGFTVNFAHVSAIAYFDLNLYLNPPTPIGPPYPGTINFQMISFIFRDSFE